MQTRLYLIIALIIGIILGAGGAILLIDPGTIEHPAPDRDLIFQISTIKALHQSVYDGVMPVSDITTYGDLGIGTFDSLDGELILIDGIVYQARGDGSIRVAPHDLLVPSATMTFFDPEIIIPNLSTGSYAECEEVINDMIRSTNLLYAIRIDGTFAEVTVRAPHRQEKPYPRLVDALADQHRATHTNISGTALGFLIPEYLGEVAIPGYHLHFISDDRSVGGHIVEFSLDSARVAVDEKRAFQMQLPSDGGFIGIDLDADISDEHIMVQRPQEGGISQA